MSREIAVESRRSQKRQSTAVSSSSTTQSATSLSSNTTPNASASTQSTLNASFSCQSVLDASSTTQTTKHASFTARITKDTSHSKLISSSKTKIDAAAIDHYTFAEPNEQLAKDLWNSKCSRTAQSTKEDNSVDKVINICSESLYKQPAGALVNSSPERLPASCSTNEEILNPEAHLEGVVQDESSQQEGEFQCL